MRPLVLGALALFAAPGLACRVPASPPAVAGGSAGGVAGEASRPGRDPARPTCDRVCAIQTRCGGDAPKCSQRCLPIARVLQADVLEQMVSCVERRAKGPCATGSDGAEDRRRLVGVCTIEATASRLADARTNVDRFAKVYCERRAACGIDPSSSTTSLATCLGEAKGAILSTEGEASGGIYGALRPSKVDEIVACLEGACEERKPRADDDLGRCLDALLARAAEPVP